jgi:uncharacterized membrane protein YhaH (DUF805 family)
MGDGLFSFDGRVGVPEFRRGILMSIFIALGIGSVTWLAATAGFALVSRLPLDAIIVKVAPIAQALACLVSGWIQAALSTRRFHDRGRSGWWLLAGLVPVVGLIWIFQELVLRDGDRAPNDFGPAPRLKMAQRK